MTDQRSSKERVYAVCEYLRGKPCSRCSSSVDTPYGKGVQGCYAVAEETIAVVERTRTTDEPKATDEGVADARRWIAYLESEPQHEPDISIARVLRDLVQFYEWALPQITNRTAEPPSPSHREYDMTIGERGEAYLKARGFDVRCLPGNFFWQELWDAMRGTAVTKSASECGACDKPGEHCANVHGICSRHGGRAHETSEGQSS